MGKKKIKHGTGMKLTEALESGGIMIAGKQESLVVRGEDTGFHVWDVKDRKLGSLSRFCCDSEVVAIGLAVHAAMGRRDKDLLPKW